MDKKTEKVDLDAVALRKLADRNESVKKILRSTGFNRGLELFKAGIKRGKSSRG